MVSLIFLNTCQFFQIFLTILKFSFSIFFSFRYIFAIVCSITWKLFQSNMESCYGDIQSSQIYMQVTNVKNSYGFRKNQEWQKNKIWFFCQFVNTFTLSSLCKLASLICLTFLQILFLLYRKVCIIIVMLIKSNQNTLYTKVQS